MLAVMFFFYLVVYKKKKKLWIAMCGDDDVEGVSRGFCVRIRETVIMEEKSKIRETDAEFLDSDQVAGHVQIASFAIDYYVNYTKHFPSLMLF